MRCLRAIVLAAILVVSSGCDSIETADRTETVMAVADVPEIVLAAARTAVPGLVIHRVERENERRGIVYEIYGTANGRYYEIEIASDGTVLEIEVEDDD